MNDTIKHNISLMSTKEIEIRLEECQHSISHMTVIDPKDVEFCALLMQELQSRRNNGNC